jgi:CelD/BcsL family acetyltransferase involved in cellulose biosynthesis
MEGEGRYNPRRMSVITSPDHLAALAPEWLERCRRTPGTTPFQTPMWLLPWWRAFGSDELAVIVTPEAIAPFTIVRDGDESLGMFLGTGNSDYLDVVGDAASIVDELAALDCQMWDLQQLRPSSTMLTAPLPEGWSDAVSDHDVCPMLSLPPALSTHFQKKIRYYRRALARLGEVRVDAATPENLDELIAALFDLHAARWQQRGRPGVLADDIVQQFTREVARGMLDAGALRMYATRVNERIVAVFYGFGFGETVYYYLSGYDPALEKLSIGTLIVAHAVDEAVAAGATTFDFLRGAEEYKYSWGAKDQTNKRRQLFRA